MAPIDRSSASTVWLTGQPFTVIGVMPRGFRFARHASLGPPQPPAEAYTTFAVNLAETNPQRWQLRGADSRASRHAAGQVAAAVECGRPRRRCERLQEPRPVAVPDRPQAGSGVERPARTHGPGLRRCLSRAGPDGERRHAAARACSETRTGVRGVARARRERRRVDARNDSRGRAARAHWRHRWRASSASGEPAHSSRSLHSIFRVAIRSPSTGMSRPSSSAPAPCSDCSPRSVPALWASRTSLASLLASSAGPRRRWSPTHATGDGGRAGRALADPAQHRRASSSAASSSCSVRIRDSTPDGLLTMRVPIPPQFVPKPEDARALQDRVHMALASLPGVTGVSATTALPMTQEMSQTTVGIAGAPGNTGNPEHDRPLVDFIATRAGYVEVMRMRVLSGRAFNESRPEGVREALVDRALRDILLPERESDRRDDSLSATARPPSSASSSRRGNTICTRTAARRSTCGPRTGTSRDADLSFAIRTSGRRRR